MFSRSLLVGRVGSTHRNTTEEILVNEIAEHYWRVRRYRAIEPKLLISDDAEQIFVAVAELLPIFQRVLTAAERGVHKSLTALRQLQKDRGFVPHSAETATQPDACEPKTAPSQPSAAAATAPGFVPHYPQNTSSAAVVVVLQPPSPCNLI